MPAYITIIRIVQVVLSILVLGLVGNTLSGLNKYLGSYAVTLVAEALAFMVFCCVWTWLVVAYLLVTPLYFPVAYNVWAHLALEVISWIFWLAGFASTASWASEHSELGNKNLYIKKINGYWATSAAGAAFGALIWITFFVTLVVFCLRFNAWRTDPANAQAGGLGFAEKGHGESHQMGVVPPQHVSAPQPSQTPVYQDQAPTPVQYASATPVQYTNTPPPQQWQQSPPPPGQQY